MSDFLTDIEARHAHTTLAEIYVELIQYRDLWRKCKYWLASPEAREHPDLIPDVEQLAEINRQRYVAFQQFYDRRLRSN